MRKFIIILNAFGLFLYSCSSKVIFTRDLKERAEKAGIEMKNIQYYTGSKIVLKREISSNDANVKSGKIKFKEGKYVNVITIKKGTPGVCTGYDNDRIEISFESRSSSSIPFTRGSSFGGNQNEYWLSWIGSSSVTIKKGKVVEGFLAQVKYNGEIYDIHSGSTLKIKKNVFRKTKIEKRRLRGRKI
jgi:hypothetical protein